MELGKIQKAWIKYLRENPEKQGKFKLGMKTNGEETYCCLGALLCTKKRLQKKKLPFNTYGQLFDGNFLSITYLSNSFKSLGLYDKTGRPSDDLNLETLSLINDSDVPWSEIADLVEKNPEHYFYKSV